MKKGKKAAIAIILAVAVAFLGYLAYAWDAGSISLPISIPRDSGYNS